jgi:DNA end-binding protein Ku
MRESGRCALARWAWKGKEYVVQVRANDDGIVLQQLLYADEIRSMKDLDIEKVDVQKAELSLALQLISQIAAESYDPAAFVDEEKQRILGAIDQKIAGNEITDRRPPNPPVGRSST